MAQQLSDCPTVTILGGGLAGMAAALRLRQAGCEVDLYESHPALGGKSGSRLIDRCWEDHGYHLVFGWYLNLLSIFHEIGIDQRWIHNDGYHLVKAGRWPERNTLRAVFNARGFLQDILSSMESIPDRLLFHYTMLDLLSQDYVNRDDESVDCFASRRWYCTDSVREQLSSLILGSQGIRTTSASARTWRTVFAAFCRDGTHLCLMPNSSLQEALIDPWQKALDEAGVRVWTEHTARRLSSDGERVTEVVFDSPDGVVHKPTDQLILALPHEAIINLEGDIKRRTFLGSSKFKALPSRPLAAAHVYIDSPIENMPKDNLRLVGSPHSLSVIDVSRTRAGYYGACLSIVVGDPGELLKMRDEEAMAAIVSEVAEYVPGVESNRVYHTVWQSNVDAPFVNDDVGSWEQRPDVLTSVPNLLVAGDFVRSHVNVSCMEGATVTGLMAAEAIRQRLRLAGPPIKVRAPRPIAPAAARFLAVALAPLAGVCRILAGRAKCAEPRPRHAFWLSTRQGWERVRNVAQGKRN